MYPIIFRTLPEIFSFITVIFLVQVGALLLATGRRYLKQASLITVGIAGAVIGEGISLSVYPAGAWIAIAVGLAGGLQLGYRLRPVGVGMALAFLAFYGATYIVNIEFAQYIAAMVLFAYGLLLTDLAPTFVSCLLASAILLLSGIWMGVQVPLLMTVITSIAAARILVAVLPPRIAGRNQAAMRPSPRS
jgi:hypothetical protein